MGIPPSAHVLKHESGGPFCRDIHLFEGNARRSGDCSFSLLECDTDRSKSKVVHAPKPTCFGGIFCSRAAADHRFGVYSPPDHRTLGLRRDHAGPTYHRHGFDSNLAMDFRADVGFVVYVQARSKQ